jgi:hypothetical protein
MDHIEPGSRRVGTPADHHSHHAFGMLGSYGQADWATHVLNDDDELAETKMIQQQRFDPTRMFLRSVAKARRMIRVAKPREIVRNATAMRT